MKIRNFVSATMIAAALVTTVAACGSDDSDAVPEPVTASSAAPGAGTGAGSGGTANDITVKSKPPSIESLNSLIDQALSTSVSNEEKTNLVEGSEADPGIFDKLVQARKEHPEIGYKLTPPVVRQGNGRAKVTVQVTTEGSPPQNFDAYIVFDKGRWKLSNGTVCLLLSAYNVKSPMCADSGASASAKPSN